MKQNNSPKLLSLLFNNIVHTNRSTNPPNRLNPSRLILEVKAKPQKPHILDPGAPSTRLRKGCHIGVSTVIGLRFPKSTLKTRTKTGLYKDSISKKIAWFFICLAFHIVVVWFLLFIIGLKLLVKAYGHIPILFWTCFGTSNMFTKCGHLDPYLSPKYLNESRTIPKTVFSQNIVLHYHNTLDIHNFDLFGKYGTSIYRKRFFCTF